MKLCSPKLQRLESRTIYKCFGNILTSGVQRRSLTSRRCSSISAADLQFGQPLHETHPHLLKAGERKFEPGFFFNKIELMRFSTVTPGIAATEYAQRRSKLASKLPKNAVAILAASNVKFRSGAVFYKFHQESNFSYLTGTIDPHEDLNQVVKGSQVSKSPTL